MQIHYSILTVLCTALLVTQACAEEVQTCPPGEGVALQVLGSGGPIADDGRASTAYLLWVDGKSRVLIDAGGGSFLRFGEARAAFFDLDFIGLSHFHTDHSADFPALLKSGVFSGRERPLTVAGPSGNHRFPGLHKYLSSMLDSGDGAYGYLSGYLDGSGGLARIDSIEIAEQVATSDDLLAKNSDEIAIYAMHVPHGIVPAIAFRVEIRGNAFVFSSDQNASNDRFAEFAKGAAVLVMHMPIPENAGEGARQLHAIPSKIAAVAAAADAESLLLSHFMARSLSNFELNVALVREAFAGELLIAEDLYCHTAN